MTPTRRLAPAALLVALPAALLAAGPAAVAQEQAGVSAAVRGDVQVAAAAPAASATQAVGRQVRSGEPIFLGDRIRSAADSGMQLMLLDETTFTIGPSSEIEVDRFVFDPARGKGEVAVAVARGAFRFVTGKIARAEPRDMQVRTPVGTIGIRGTIVFGRIDGTRAIIALAGPGGAGNAGGRRGGFDFFPAGGGAPFEVRRTGWAIVVEPGQPIQQIELPPERFDALANLLEARGPRRGRRATARGAAAAAISRPSGRTGRGAPTPRRASRPRSRWTASPRSPTSWSRPGSSTISACRPTPSRSARSTTPPPSAS